MLISYQDQEDTFRFIVLYSLFAKQRFVFWVQSCSRSSRKVDEIKCNTAVLLRTLVCPPSLQASGVPSLRKRRLSSGVFEFGCL